MCTRDHFKESESALPDPLSVLQCAAWLLDEDSSSCGCLQSSEMLQVANALM